MLAYVNFFLYLCGDFMRACGRAVHNMHIYKEKINNT